MNEELDFLGFFLGAKLGDGGFCKKSPNHHTYVVFSQCEEQYNYLVWKYNYCYRLGVIKKSILKQLNPLTRHCFNNAQNQYTFSTTSMQELDMFVTTPLIDLIQLIDNLALSIFILDDGNVYNKCTRISCGVLSDEERNMFVNVVNNKYNTHCRIYHNPSKKVKDYFYFPSKDYDILKTIIHKSIPNDLDIIENKFQDIAAMPDAIIKIKYIDKNNHIPLTRIEGEKSNWIDLRANQDYILKKGDFEYIDLGVAMELPYGYEGILAPRSSTFKKFGIIAANSIGIIDNKFNGDDDIWKFPALALRDTEIHKNDRICQFRIQRVQPVIEFKTVDNLNNISRGGFGSTGSN